MHSSRRDFLSSSAAAAGSFLLFSGRALAQDASARRPLDLLILGGTQFLGPAIVQAARARGHRITLFNRGKTRPGLFPDLEQLQGDRDPAKGEGIKALQGRKWDVVFDDCGYYPRMVKASAELLAPNVRQYVFVSSISAYQDNSKEQQDETAALGTMPDPTLEKMGEKSEYYGPLKALCEQAAERALPGRATIVRPGYIVGPGDPSDRFTYWPVRVARGGEVLAPGAPSDPIQVIDVRDLAQWLVLVAEQNTTGTFNACGPERRLGMGEVLAGCKAASSNDARFTWVDGEFLIKQGENGDGNLPIWAPYLGEYRGFHTWSNARAVKAGLTFRPIATICKDTLDWFRTLPPERQQAMRAGLTTAQEARILEAWRKHA